MNMGSSNANLGLSSRHSVSSSFGNFSQSSANKSQSGGFNKYFSMFQPAKAPRTATVMMSANADATPSKVQRNPNFAKLQAGYLFPEIGRRSREYKAANEDSRAIISLGIGDTTQPIPSNILNGLLNGVNKLGKKETYSGYGDG